MQTRGKAKGRDDHSGTRSNESKEAKGKFMKKSTTRKAAGPKRHADCCLPGETNDTTGLMPTKSLVQSGDVVEENYEQKENKEHADEENIELLKERSAQVCLPTNREETEDTDWEDGYIALSDSRVNDNHNGLDKGVIVEFNDSSSFAKPKPIRRVSAEDKELAELTHKVHLLCLIARGRLVDSACNDPLIQASLISLLPPHLHDMYEVQKLTADQMASLVEWFRNNFHVRNQSTRGRPFKSCLSSAIETREGTSEEVAALSVALFRALNLTTRFISILDVAPLKPDINMSGYSNRDAPGMVTRGSPKSSGMKVANLAQVFDKPPFDSKLPKTNPSQDTDHVIAQRECWIGENDAIGTTQPNLSQASGHLNSNSEDGLQQQLSGKACNTGFEGGSKFAEGSKRKGDLEFELQMEMALSATATGSHNYTLDSDLKDRQGSSSYLNTPLKSTKRIKCQESPTSAQGSSSAVWSRKVGPPLYWAEVFCNGENLTGRWVHIDAANAIVDGESKVEAAVAACRSSLRYVVAFAGFGAKDVTRRYFMKWYTIASKRINSQWWNAVLAPLKELESGATGAMHGELSSYGVDTRSSIEDMELETRALTEPLPTNQLAYKNHHLYAIERWLTKYQVLHPRCPILGYCSGHPVFPRTCVQLLQTKQRWFREGLQVKSNESPAKVVKHSQKFNKGQSSVPDVSVEDECEGTVALYGRWQTEPLNLPHAVDGIVPKNEWGRVDAWSEKCLPPGTIHLRFPRLAMVAKRLEIDFAPAMVGFEFKNGRSFPVYEGIVVCREFKDAIMEAYAEEEERREAEDKKRTEAQAMSRWRQLLSSMITRQRLKESYEDSSSQAQYFINPKDDYLCATPEACREDKSAPPACQQGSFNDARSDFLSLLPDNHEHVFLVEDQIFDMETSVKTKRCSCGFSLQVEEM